MRGRTANDAIAQRRADALGHPGGGDDELVGAFAPKEAVTRRTVASGRQRNPRGASTTGIEEHVESPSDALPSATRPSAPPTRAEHDAARVVLARATSSSPAGVERALVDDDARRCR